MERLSESIHRFRPPSLYRVKGQSYKRARTSIKLYALVCVCMLTEATNILCLEGLETQDVVGALERHASRHGVPAHVYVDNGISC